MKDTLFVAVHEPHYANLALAQAAGADVYRIPVEMTKFSSKFSKAAAILQNSAALPSNYNFYFTESTFFYPAIRRKLFLIPRNSKIINLFATPLLYFLHNNMHIYGSERKAMLSLLNDVDACVLLGTLGSELARKFDSIKGKPSMRTSLWMTPKVTGAIDKIGAKYNPASKNIFTTARFDFQTKGMDIVLKAFENSHKNDNELKLHILGGVKMPHTLLNSLSLSCQKNIIQHGNLSLENYASKLPEFSLYVHMGRGEAFGLAVAEAMYASIPAIVSSQTGSRDLVSKVDKKMIVPLDAHALSAQMEKFLSLSEGKKLSISKKAREEATHYTEKEMAPKFAKEFAALKEKL